MLLLSLAFGIATMDGQTARCSGTATERTCQEDQGSIYVERTLSGRRIRQGTQPGGQTWTEYIIPEFDGTRLIGSDTGGRSWYQTCTPREGTRGNDRRGAAVYIAPQRLPAKPDTNEPKYAPCP